MIKADAASWYVTPDAETVRELSLRLVRAQSPLRLLESVRWSESVEADFFARGSRELPRVEYAPLTFQPSAKHAEFRQLADDIRRRLGPTHPASRIMISQCEGFRGVVDLLASRGKPAFSSRSLELFGQPDADALRQFERIDISAGAVGEPRWSAEAACGHLTKRFHQLFPSTCTVRVRVTPRLNADAAAAGLGVKLRRDASFTSAELDLLEVHEGWVHLGTTVNARSQPVCGFLRVAAPSATRTQEGLAVLIELTAGVATADRIRRLAERHRAVLLAAHGANFLDVYRYFAATSLPREAYRKAARVFRGSRPDAGPFAKDATYVLGFVRLLDEATTDLRRLTLGKTAIESVDDLATLTERGLVAPPPFELPPFAAADFPERLAKLRRRVKVG